MHKYSINHKISNHVWSGTTLSSNESVIICRSLVESSGPTFDRANALLAAHKAGVIAAQDFFFSTESTGQVLYAIVPDSLESLQDVLDRPLRFDTIRSLFRSLLQSLSILHSHGTFHGDIRTDTLAVVNNRVLLSPFALSPRSSSSRSSQQLSFLPPEQLLPDPSSNSYPPLDFSTDLWSAGVVGLAMFKVGGSMTPLFAAPGVAEQIAKTFKILGVPSPTDLPSLPIDAARHLINSVRPSSPPLLPRLLVSHELPSSSVSLFQGLLSFCPIKRYSADVALQSNFLIDSAPFPSVSMSFSSSLPSRPITTRSKSIKTQSNSTSESSEKSTFLCNFDKKSSSTTRSKSVSTIKSQSPQSISPTFSAQSRRSSVSEREADQLLQLFQQLSPPLPSRSPSHFDLKIDDSRDHDVVSDCQSIKSMTKSLSNSTVDNSFSNSQSRQSRKRLPSPPTSPSDCSLSVDSFIASDDDVSIDSNFGSNFDETVDTSQIINELMNLANKLKQTHLRHKSQSPQLTSTKEIKRRPDGIQKLINDLCVDEKRSPSQESVVSVSSITSLSTHYLSDELSCDNSIKINITSVKNLSMPFLQSRTFSTDINQMKVAVVTSLVDTDRTAQISRSIFSRVSPFFNFQSNILSDRLSATPNATCHFPIDTCTLIEKILNLLLNVKIVVGDTMIGEALIDLETLRYLPIDGWYNLYPHGQKSSSIGQIHVEVKLNNQIVPSFPPELPLSPISISNEYEDEGYYRPQKQSNCVANHFDCENFDENLENDTNDFVSQYLCETLS
ncbi:hypothetical protein RCL1_004562 [Eukaryota sp. TZLM3-RCL]